MKPFYVMILLALVALLLAAGILIKTPCDLCNGRGNIGGDRTVRVVCPDCGGSGRSKSGEQLSQPSRVKSTFQVPPSKCLRCRGNGYTENVEPPRVCPVCGGARRISLLRSLFRNVSGQGGKMRQETSSP